jgi:hypothetical protein
MYSFVLFGSSFVRINTKSIYAQFKADITTNDLKRSVGTIIVFEKCIMLKMKFYTSE